MDADVECLSIGETMLEEEVNKTGQGSPYWLNTQHVYAMLSNWGNFCSVQQADGCIPILSRPHPRDFTKSFRANSHFFPSTLQFFLTMYLAQAGQIQTEPVRLQRLDCNLTAHGSQRRHTCAQFSRFRA